VFQTCGSYKNSSLQYSTRALVQPKSDTAEVVVCDVAGGIEGLCLTRQWIDNILQSAKVADEVGFEEIVGEVVVCVGVGIEGLCEGGATGYGGKEGVFVFITNETVRTKLVFLLIVQK
jgi:hypothetical protein